MIDYFKHDGEAALKWANHRLNLHWLWWRYEQSSQTFVLSCWQEEPWEQVGFLILRGVKEVEFAAFVSNVSFSAEASGLASLHYSRDETLTKQTVPTIHIQGKGINYHIQCISFSLYECSNQSEIAD